MNKWIPIYGMFTKEANDIPSGVAGESTSLIMVLYHGFIGAGIICLIGYLILKP